jgi:thiamine biosynthesis lipoprotein
MSALGAVLAWPAIDPGASHAAAAATLADGHPAPVTTTTAMMGGHVAVSLAAADSRATALRDSERVIARMAAWASRLTRFSPDSDLSRVNGDPREVVPLTPTMASVLDWARTAEHFTDGIVDVAWLDARLAAEGLGPRGPRPGRASRAWSLDRSDPRVTWLRRPVGLRLDLDGVAKGWLADRALDLVLRRAPGRTALVDGDGDVAVRVAAGSEILVGVADPRVPDGTLAVVRLAAGVGPRRFGVATSGVSVHRWTHGRDAAHHLIDPVTWRPALTDVVQATVLADTARAAEAFAKVAVLAGSDLAATVLDRPGVHGVLLLTTRGEIRATPGMLPWLA